MYCTHCGAQLPDNARFCTSCGMQVQQQQAPATRQEPTSAPPSGFAAPPATSAQSTPPPGNKRKTGLLIALIGGGALLTAVAVFFGIRLLRNRDDADNASAQSPLEDAASEGAAGESAALPSLPAYALPPEASAKPAPASPAQEEEGGTTDSDAQDGRGGPGELESTLPGLWLSEPDSDGDRSLVFIGEREFGSALAFPEKGAGLESFPEGFDVRLFGWYGYRAQGGTLYLIDHDGTEIAYEAQAISHDEIELVCEDEYLSLLHPRLHRVGAAELPPLLWFMQGGWVAEQADKDGNHVAMQFSPDGDTYCEVWTTRTADSPPKFGEWSRGKWQHESRISGEFEIVADLLHIEFGDGGTLDFALEVNDPWTMLFWTGDKSFTFKRMDWLPSR